MQLVMRGEVTRRPDSSHAVSVDGETYAALHAPPRETLVVYLGVPRRPSESLGVPRELPGV